MLFKKILTIYINILLLIITNYLCIKLNMLDKKIELINKLLPNFNINTCKVLNCGVNSLAILINNEYIFRFPLQPLILLDYIKEQEILNKIRPFIKTTKIPELKIYQTNEDAFTCHKCIYGDNYLKIKKPNLQFKKKLSKQIAQFLYELHSININNFQNIETQQFDVYYYDIIDKNKILKELLQNDFIDDLDLSIDYLLKYNHFEKENNVLCHNDLHEENIIVNKNGLAGIIDFTELCIKKRENDFGNLFVYDFNLGLMIIKEYELLINQKLDLEYIYNLQKIKCYGLFLWFVKNNNEKYTKIFRQNIINLNHINLIV